MTATQRAERERSSRAISQAATEIAPISALRPSRLIANRSWSSCRMTRKNS